MIIGSDTLELEVARTSSAITPVSFKDEENIVVSGYLNKKGINGKWHQRWFALKKDNCLYYFKSQMVSFMFWRIVYKIFITIKLEILFLSQL